jgi:hypothetical protein
MKKLLTVISLMFITLTSFSQTYFRSNSLYIGNKVSEKSDIYWDKTKIDANLLIKLEKNTTTIFSDKVQKYYVIEQKESNKSFARWLCSDLEGKNCYLTVGSLDDGSLYISLEYADMAWVYFGNLE